MTKAPERPTAEDERRTRSGEALRANLRRRKEQARGRSDETRGDPPPEAGDQN